MLRGLLMMILIGGVVGYGNLILKSLEMIRDHSYKYGVDDSHNHKHSSEVLHFVSEINMNCYDRKRMNILILRNLIPLFHHFSEEDLLNYFYKINTNLTS